jgi:RimJ/RimL family protein N-acetyltransferase
MNELNGIIISNRAILRKYTVQDREAFALLFTDKEVNFYMGGEHCETMEDVYKLFDKCFEIYSGKYPERYFEIWAVEFENKMIGHAELKQTNNTTDNELEVVYLLYKNYQGKGFMTEILKELNEYAKRSGKKMIATVNPENEKSVRVLVKTGIEKEGWITEGKDKYYKIWIK